MTDLVEFIEARLTDDERIALAATRNAWTVDHWTNDDDREFLVVADYDQGAPAFAIKSEADADHIARHDPARVLREVEGKRALLAYLVDLAAKALDSDWWNLDTDLPLQLLAAAWSAHPGYRAEWGPS